MMEIAQVDATLGLASHPVYTTSVRLAHSASTRNFSTITPIEEAFIAFEQSENVKILGIGLGQRPVGLPQNIMSIIRPGQDVQLMENWNLWLLTILFHLNIATKCKLSKKRAAQNGEEVSIVHRHHRQHPVSLESVTQPEREPRMALLTASKSLRPER